MEMDKELRTCFVRWIIVKLEVGIKLKKNTHEVFPCVFFVENVLTMK